VPTHPAVAVTATTERIRGLVRVRVNESYTAAVQMAGLRPYVLPVLSAEDADAMLDGMSGLVLTGGEDIDPSYYGAPPHPALGDVHAGRDAFEIAIARAAHARKLPTLAICRGIQVAAVAWVERSCRIFRPSGRERCSMRPAVREMRVSMRSGSTRTPTSPRRWERGKYESIHRTTNRCRPRRLPSAWSQSPPMA
jgi:Predicted glutamine amidotransferases